MEIKIEKSKIIAEANNCTAVKEALMRLAPDAFKKKGWKDVDSYETACEMRLVDEEDRLYDTDSLYIRSLKKLFHIRKAMAPDFIPDYSNSDQKKWYGWFDLSSSCRFVHAN